MCVASTGRSAIQAGCRWANDQHVRFSDKIRSHVYMRKEVIPHEDVGVDVDTERLAIVGEAKRRCDIGSVETGRNARVTWVEGNVRYIHAPIAGALRRPLCRGADTGGDGRGMSKIAGSHRKLRHDWNFAQLSWPGVRMILGFVSFWSYPSSTCIVCLPSFSEALHSHGACINDLDNGVSLVQERSKGIEPPVQETP